MEREHKGKAEVSDLYLRHQLSKGRSILPEVVGVVSKHAVDVVGRAVRKADASLRLMKPKMWWYTVLTAESMSKSSLGDKNACHSLCTAANGEVGAG